jgi:hypothetical protein
VTSELIWYVCLEQYGDQAHMQGYLSAGAEAARIVDAPISNK